MVRRRNVFVPLHQLPPCTLLGCRLYLNGHLGKPLQFDVAPPNADVISMQNDRPNHGMVFILEHQSFAEADDCSIPPMFRGKLFAYPVDAFGLLDSPAEQTTWRQRPGLFNLPGTPL